MRRRVRALRAVAGMRPTATPPARRVDGTRAPASAPGRGAGCGDRRAAAAAARRTSLLLVAAAALSAARASFTSSTVQAPTASVSAAIVTASRSVPDRHLAVPVWEDGEKGK